MLSTVELLDLARAHQGDVSDYRLAKLLDIRPQTVCNYRAGLSYPQNPIAARLAALCGLDPAAVVCWVNLERAGTDLERQTWLLMLDRVERSPAAEMAAA